MKVITNAIFLLLLTQASCKKDNSDPLPPETHTGAFTFGCKIDGKVYTTMGKAEFEGLDFGSVSYSPSFGDSTIYISAEHPSDPNFRFDIRIPYTGGTGTYSLKSFSYNGTFQDKDIIDTTVGTKSIYRTNEIDTGSVIITYFNGTYTPYFGGTILAGTFQMDAVNGEGKVIHITDGRFDIGQ